MHMSYNALSPDTAYSINLLILKARLSNVLADAVYRLDDNEVSYVPQGNLKRIVISGSKDDPQLHYVQRIAIPDSSAVRRKLTNVKDFNKVVIKRKDGKPSKWESTMHLYAGVNTLTSATDDYDVKLWPSLEIGIGPTWDFYPYGKHNVWRAGIGVAWATFRFDKDYFWKKRPVTVDALAVVKIPKLPGLYCKYSPMTVFKDNRGPKMRQLSFGIMF